MLQNVILLLITSTLIPLVPISPFYFVPLTVAQIYLEEPTVFHLMNLNRLHDEAEFKKTFRSSIKAHHPDLGGDKAIFAQIKDLKEIMEHPSNPYDKYNITHVDLALNLPLDEVIAHKQFAYEIECFIFYFITFLYIITITKSEKGQACRAKLVVLLLVAVLYEVYLNKEPENPTLFDIFDGKAPLFVQFKFIKRTIILILVIVATHYARKTNLQYQLIQKFQRNTTELKEHILILEGLNQIYSEKIKDSKGIMTKIKKIISGIVSVLLFLVLIYSFIN